MVYNEKLLSLDILIIAKTLDFTRLKGTFEEKIMLSYMVYNEKLKNVRSWHVLKPLILLAYKHIF